MSALICGSLAYDNIMAFDDHFKNHILSEKLHMLSVAFLVPEMRQEFGGCAGNIAYSMKLLEVAAHPMGTVGKDFGRYADWIETNQISTKYLATVADQFTAQAFITSDLDGNQITMFHPGAMNMSHLNSIKDANGIDIGIVSPDGRDGMVQHAAQFCEAGIPFIFDPGQGLPMFDGADLKFFIKQAAYVIVNEYEWEILSERTGYTEADITAQVSALIVTLGAQGSVIHTKDKPHQIPIVHSNDAVDPTGCGDAYRAGLLYGLQHGLPWETIGHIASLMGTIVVEHAGTQNHRFKLGDFKARFKENFGYEF